MYGLPHIVACDLGIEFTKIGYCGDESPKIYSQTCESMISPASLARELLLLNEKEPMHLIITENNAEKKDFLEFLFEHSVIESLLFFDSDILDLLAYNRINGVVVNYGGGTTVTSIVDGFVENKVKKEGGLRLNEELRGNGLEDVHRFKEEYLEIGGCQMVEFGDVVYNTLDINQKAEELFVVGEVVKSLIEKSDSKNVLSNNIYMAGGGAKTRGLEIRMKEELKGFRNKISYEQKFHSFFGASVLGSIAQSRSLFICSRDYEEHGESILSRKTLR